jgi:hypothetical protein
VTDTEPFLVKPRDVARYVGVSYEAVRLRMRSGRLKTIQHGRVPMVLRSSMMRWVKERELAQVARYDRRMAKIAALQALLANGGQ